MNRRLRMMLVITAVLTIVPLVGAGGAGASRVAAGSKPVVKIGVLAPLDAGLTEFGQGIRNSVQVAVDQANKRNAIPGWKIELVSVNDSSDPATGAAGAATLAADPAVIGVVGPYNSGVAEAALPALAAADLALISPSNTLTSLTLGPSVANPVRPYDSYFRLVASDALQGPYLAESIYARGVRTVAVVSETKPVSQGLADAFAAAFTDQGGTVTIQQTVPDGATDFTDFLGAALPGDPDAIFFGGEYPVAAALRDQATTAGFSGPLVGGDGIKDDAYIDDAGAASKGTLASTVGTPLASLRTAKRFLAAYKKAGFDTAPTDYGPYAFDAANLIIGAAADVLAGQTSIPLDARATVSSALQATNVDGASGPVGFDQYGDTTHSVFTLYRVSGPKKHLVWLPLSK
jgi:branched-chain amino acid transport system substrate-binding protein